MPSLAKWHCKEPADMLATHSNLCSSSRPMQTADSRTNDPSAQNASRPACKLFRISIFLHCQLPAGYVYLHTSHPSIEFFTLDAYVQDSQNDTDFDPDMLSDDGT